MKFFKFFKKSAKPMMRYTMLNLETGEIEVYDLREGNERAFVVMGYYDIIKEERI